MMNADTLAEESLAAIEAAADSSALEAVRVSLLGRNGSIAGQLRALGSLEPAARRARGQALNRIRDLVQERITERGRAFRAEERRQLLARDGVDLTLPVRPELTGSLHPVSQVTEEVAAIFADLGFDLQEGPEIETEFYNFDALNIPPEHPARQEHDTFFFPDGGEGAERRVLRTHTSNVQIRTLRLGPPVRFIAAGRTYRCDSDLTHTPMFHQVEGMAIDHDVHMGHLRWTLEEFLKAFFEADRVELRFRASHFPFTEPSAEVDVRCSWKDGRLVIGEGENWLEILGCGMTHPNVIRACGVDPEVWQGFAFGIGIDRLAMLKYGMPDLRAFFDGDMRWLRHYGFHSADAPSVHAGITRSAGAGR